MDFYCIAEEIDLNDQYMKIQVRRVATATFIIATVISITYFILGILLLSQNDQLDHFIIILSILIFLLDGVVIYGLIHKKRLAYRMALALSLLSFVSLFSSFQTDGFLFSIAGVLLWLNRKEFSE